MVVSTGWTITAYFLANEILYSGTKTDIMNKTGDLLGRYKTDFVDAVKIQGTGLGDGINNPVGKYLTRDGEGNYKLISQPWGAYAKPIFSWASNNPSVAINPVSWPQGTKLKILQLSSEQYNYPAWVKDRLYNKLYSVDDKFASGQFGNQKRIDIFAGLETTLDHGYSDLLFSNCTIDIPYDPNEIHDVSFMQQPQDYKFLIPLALIIIMSRG